MEADIGPALPAYDDMVGQADVQQLPGFLYLFREPYILPAWQGVSRWVVVDQDYLGRSRRQCPDIDFPW